MIKLDLSIDGLDEILKFIPKKGIVILKGNLASGKTTLVKKIANFYGVNDSVTSPTFSVMQTYESKNNKIHHYDIYQDGFDAVIKNGLFENFFEDDLHLIEWGDEALEKMLSSYGLEYTVIVIEPLSDIRRYKIYGS